MTQYNENEQRTRTFNPNEHVMQLKSREGSKDYLPVQWRLVWFREACPQGTIDTEELEYDLDREVEAEVYVWNPEKKRSEKVIKKARGYARYRAVVTDGRGGRATGTKSENAANFADFGEKAETGAVGRALAGLGYGTQFAPEFNEEHRIVDSPVERVATSVVEHNNPVASNSNNGQRGIVTVRPPSTPANGNGNGNQAEPAANSAITEKQVLSIRKLCEHLQKAEPANIEKMTFGSARELINQLTAEYRATRRAS
jgi:hypothetical protein